jgi:hypothetical protein
MLMNYGSLLGRLKAQKSFFLGMATMLLVAGIGGAWLTLGRSSAAVGSIPSEILAAADFPLYYPETLPKGYAADPSSFSIGKDVVTYAFTYGDEDKLAVSLQPIPSAFDFDTFYQKTMGGAVTLKTETGMARIGPMNGIQTISLVADKTWILITAPNGAANKDLVSIASALRPASPN